MFVNYYIVILTIYFRVHIHLKPISMDKQLSSVKYLIASEQDISWGVVVNSAGTQRVEPGASYPLTNHPMRYLFSTQKGRTLEEYQLIYISEGKGEFMSGSKKKVIVNEGCFILLFPGEWHNYNPIRSTGWHESWIGFNGVDIDRRINAGFFSKEEPIFNVGINEEIVNLYLKAISVAQHQEAGYQQMLGGIVNILLGYAYAANKQMSFEDMKVVNQISKAKMLMQENLNKNITPEDIASMVNMSYSWFRRIFKQYTGFSPAQYIQELRIKRSKELLTNTSLASKEIAFEAGFETPYYFCLVFKKKTGLTPIEYRGKTQGTPE